MNEVFHLMLLHYYDV